MTPDKHSNKKIGLKNYLKRNSLFILLLLILIFLEFFSHNYRFFINHFFLLKERVYKIDEGTLYGFRNENGVLVSEHNDPNFTIRDIDERVKYIDINCVNPNPDSLSQVFYRKQDQDWADINSVTFKIDEPKTTIYLPQTTQITSLRFDLTDTEGDRITCTGITINPVVKFNFNFLRLTLILLCILGLIFGHKFIPAHISESVWEAFINNGILAFIPLIILIDITYPVTITFDSGHYLWLAEFINQGNYAQWDVVRNIGFPLIIYLSTHLFGYTQQALLTPLIISHVILFIFCVQIAITALQVKNKELRLLIALIVFLVIVLDPTVVGYFHVLLTEYLGATIAVLSSFIALKLYQTEIFSKKFFAYSGYFAIMVPIAWQIKQPYLGAALFPFIIVCSLIIFRKFSKSTLAFGFIANLIVLLLVFFSNTIWNNFLSSQANPMNERRQFSTIAETRINRTVDRAKADMLNMVKTYTQVYIDSTNYGYQDKKELSSSPWTSAFQNRLIAHRMYRYYKGTNIVFKPNFYTQFAMPFKADYTPIRWLNNLFMMRITASNFLFIATFLFLPFVSVIWLIIWLFDKSLLNASILVLAGTSFLNALGHLLASPIDRYLFLGYPLNLLVLLILLSILIKFVKIRWLPNLKQKQQ